MSQQNSPSPYSQEESDRIREENYKRTQTFNVFQEAMLWHARENHIPYKATFELTPRCSMRCGMCYMRLDPPQMEPQGRELTTEEWIRLGKMAAEAGTLDLVLTGGEPMIRRDFAEIYKAFTEMGFLLRVFTNATMVTAEIMELLKERPPQSMEITLYGASPETYERVGRYAKGYDLAVAAIEELRTFVPSLKLKMTVARQNADDFPALLQFAHERALPLETTMMLLPPIRGAHSTALSDRLTVDELLVYYQKHGIQISDGNPAPDAEKRTTLFCDAGLNTYSICWNGDMVACLVDDDPGRPIGRPLEEGFQAAWDKLKAFRENKPMPEECRTCPAFADCGCCAVHHRLESGAYDVPAPYVCGFYRRACGVE